MSNYSEPTNFFSLETNSLLQFIRKSVQILLVKQAFFELSLTYRKIFYTSETLWWLGFSNDQRGFLFTSHQIYCKKHFKAIFFASFQPMPNYFQTSSDTVLKQRPVSFMLKICSFKIEAKRTEIHFSVDSTSVSYFSPYDFLKTMLFFFLLPS